VLLLKRISNKFETQTNFQNRTNNRKPQATALQRVVTPHPYNSLDVLRMNGVGGHLFLFLSTAPAAHQRLSLDDVSAHTAHSIWNFGIGAWCWLLSPDSSIDRAF